MSVDHGVIPKAQSQRAFLGVFPGDVVVVWDNPNLVDTNSDAWWMGEVIFVEGSARDPKAPSLFQVADVDTGVVRWVNADCVQKVLLPVSQPFSAEVLELAAYR